jgi:hypothetical protein
LPGTPVLCSVPRKQETSCDPALLTSQPAFLCSLTLTCVCSSWSCAVPLHFHSSWRRSRVALFTPLHSSSPTGAVASLLCSSPQLSLRLQLSSSGETWSEQYL